MFLSDLFSRPPPGSIKFNNAVRVPPPRIGLKIDIELDLVHTVLKAVEGENPTGASHTERLHGLKNLFGGELEEELGG